MGCWKWIAGRDRDGYGVYGNKLAHRLSYQQYKGKIYKNKVLDHLCKNTWCINPVHLEQVTQEINVLRGNSFSAINKRKTHCINGHRLLIENLYISYRGKHIKRQCKMCTYVRNRKNCE